MAVFDTLAENRYNEWLKRCSDPGYKPRPAKPNTACRKSYEGYLLSEILSLITQAAEQSQPAARKDLHTKARKLEIQLFMSLEKKGMPLAADTLQRSIRNHRKQAGVSATYS